MELVDGRLWVWREGEPRTKSTKNVRLVSEGPGRRTVIALDRSVAVEYVATRPGFETEHDADEDSIWVWWRGRPHDRPAKPVVREGAGPMNKTLKAGDKETLAAYVRS